MKVLLTHPGTQYSYSLAKQLERSGILYCFATCIAFGDEKKSIKNWLPGSLQKKLLRRTVKGVSSKKLWRYPLLELRSLLQIKWGSNPQQVLYERNKRFQEKIPTRLIESADIIIGFDTSSWILQERCSKAGKPFVLDVSIAHPLSQQSIFDLLRRQYPLWLKNLSKKKEHLIAIEQHEMEAADHIVVASLYTRSTYLSNGIPHRKISVNHYGTDLSDFTPKKQPGSTSGTIQFLFFGAISARKGFPWLCQVWKKFHAAYPNTALVAAGYGSLPEEFQLPEGITLTGPIHPDDRLKLFHNADVFVFPSFFEGFAQVIIEAMACGLPVITTNHTVGPEIIQDGKEGFVIAPDDSNALYRSLEFFVLHNDKIACMSQLAREGIKELTWEKYGDRWLQVLENTIGNIIEKVH